MPHFPKSTEQPTKPATPADPVPPTDAECPKTWQPRHEVCDRCQQTQRPIWTNCRNGELAAKGNFGSQLCTRYGEHDPEQHRCKSCCRSCYKLCVEETSRRAEERDRMEAGIRERRDAEGRERRAEAERSRGWYEVMLDYVKAEAQSRFGRDLYELTIRQRLTIPHCTGFYHPAGSCSGLIPGSDRNDVARPCQWAQQCGHVATAEKGQV